MNTIAIIDYGMGNLHSIAKALEHVAGRRVRVTAVAREILDAERVVFPGQGAARDCMHEIRAAGLVDVIREAAQSRPFLGICMGLQVLLEHSDEGGGVDCLGLVPGRVRSLREGLDPTAGRLKIPQMGWNQVEQVGGHPLWEGIDDLSRFYFVHSYYVDPDDPTLVAGLTDYGRRYASVLARDNVFAVQFHPEKSQHAGLRLLANFAEWDGGAPSGNSQE
ncbi:MAG: imidazole glycerol phosphate synthase subunit HisH [Gammaproteobacteria bacterium]|jgi:glutamine amidotransferase|nr:imidazole glycerol phosphate synthase subunit HisH [Gammaproteobacteria bacterium]